MKLLPHTPLKISRYLSQVSSNGESIDYPDAIALGKLLVDAALMYIKNGKEVLIYIDNEEVLQGIRSELQELNIYEEYHDDIKSLMYDWVTDSYVSKKGVKTGQVYHALGQMVDNVSLFHTLIWSAIEKYVPISTYVNEIPSSLRQLVADEVRQSLQAYRPVIDYQRMLALVRLEDFSIEHLDKDLGLVDDIIRRIETDLVRVEVVGLLESELRRMNQRVGHHLVISLFDLNDDIEGQIKTFKILTVNAGKRPLNAAQLVEYLNQQLIDLKQVRVLFAKVDIQSWISHLSQAHPVSQKIIKKMAIHKQRDWVALLREYWARADSQHIVFTTNRILYSDALYYLRSTLMQIKGKLLVTSDSSVIDNHDDTIYLLPASIGKHGENIRSYNVGPAEFHYPILDQVIIRSELTDSELIHNARILSISLSDRLDQVYIYLNKDSIMISFRVLDDVECQQWLGLNDYEQIMIQDKVESLKDCFVDQTREIYVLTHGYLLDTVDISDWIYQVRLIELLEQTGVKLIDVPLSIDKEHNGPINSTTQILDEYFAG